MNISSKTEYGIRALVEVARHNQEGTALKRSKISERQRIPLPFLTQVLQALVSGGLITSSRGPGGGYNLNKRAKDVTLLEIVNLLQGPVSPKECLNLASLCKQAPDCFLRDVWLELKQANEGILKKITLSDILKEENKKVRKGSKK